MPGAFSSIAATVHWPNRYDKRSSAKTPRPNKRPSKGSRKYTKDRWLAVTAFDLVDSYYRSRVRRSAPRNTATPRPAQARPIIASPKSGGPPVKGSSPSGIVSATTSSGMLVSWPAPKPGLSPRPKSPISRSPPYWWSVAPRATALLLLLLRLLSLRLLSLRLLSLLSPPPPPPSSVTTLCSVASPHPNSVVESTPKVVELNCAVHW